MHWLSVSKTLTYYLQTSLNKWLLRGPAALNGRRDSSLIIPIWWTIISPRFHNNNEKKNNKFIRNKHWFRLLLPSLDSIGLTLIRMPCPNFFQEVNYACNHHSNVSHPPTQTHSHTPKKFEVDWFQLTRSFPLPLLHIKNGKLQQLFERNHAGLPVDLGSLYILLCESSKIQYTTSCTGASIVSNKNNSFIYSVKFS